MSGRLYNGRQYQMSRTNILQQYLHLRPSLLTLPPLAFLHGMKHETNTSSSWLEACDDVILKSKIQSSLLLTNFQIYLTENLSKIFTNFGQFSQIQGNPIKRYWNTKDLRGIAVI